MSRLFPEPEHATPAVIGTATGQFEADRIIDGIRDDLLTPDIAWFTFLDLASKSGLRSASCRAFVIGLAKRGARD